MSLKTVVNKAVNYHAENGIVTTAGAAAEYCGRKFNDRCEFVSQMLWSDHGRGYPLTLRWKAAKEGFTGHVSLWLGITGADTDQYLSSTDPIQELNRGYVRPLHHKYVFQLSTQPHIDRLPALYGTVDAGKFRPTGMAEDTLPEILTREGKLVLKPMTGGKGKGVCVLHGTERTRLENGTETIEAPVGNLIADLDGYLVTEFVRQHGYAEQIFPEATNTIRIHSIVDPNSGEISLLRASHRFGSPKSIPTDNWSRGGYVAPIDIDTGEIGRLIVLDDPPRSRPQRHPETGAQVAGVTVPYWEELCDLVREAAELHRYAPFVGWDVAVTDEGPLLVEANARPSVVGLQLTEGLYRDQRVRTLLERD